MNRAIMTIALLFLAAVAVAGVKIAGVEFLPKDLIFAAAEPRSRASAEGALPGDCKWAFSSETRLGRHEEANGCIRFYYKTSVTLAMTCAAPNDRPVTRLAERITAIEPRCPDGSGKVAAPNSEAKVLSSGVTSDGKQQEIILQPDGTRITLVHDTASVVCSAVFPDGSADVLRQP
ncbi:MAG TPA: hypothetical protein VFL80_02175 [Thermoanaerobaculia bacterium]|nr:hypothetical protein [Thermoanaerobaculia bacterium]